MNTRSTLWRAASLVTMFLTAATQSYAHEHLVLRVQDATARPGGQAALVLRTYQTRPVGQGTICLVVSDPNGTAPPIDAVSRVEVFSQAADVIESINISEAGNALVIDVSFVSATASVNTIDGPMAAVFFDVPADALPGTEMSLSIEPAQSFLLDELGRPIPIEIRSGDLQVLHESQPVEVSADSHPPEAPGQPASLLFETEESFEIASGQIAWRYSSRELPGTPTLRLDPRYGSATLKLDGYPGLAIVNILSSDSDFNRLPGALIALQFQPRLAFDDAFRPSVRLDPALTVLFDKEGRVIPLRIDDATRGRLAP